MSILLHNTLTKITSTTENHKGISNYKEISKLPKFLTTEPKIDLPFTAVFDLNKRKMLIFDTHLPQSGVGCLGEENEQDP